MKKSSQEKSLEGFDPNAVGKPGSLFGLPFTPENASLVIIPAPGAPTVSRGGGAEWGPAAILAASPQIDYYDPFAPDRWKKGIAMASIPTTWLRRSQQLRVLVGQCIRHLENGGSPLDEGMRELWEKVNERTGLFNDWMEEKADALLRQGKLVGVLGGDHSSPLGLFRALGRHLPHSFSVLHIDAHADLRKAYEGFTFSHASIMWNVAQCSFVSKIVHVGIRDVCEEEIAFIRNSNGRLMLYHDRDLYKARVRFKKSWHEVCEGIVSQLSRDVYVSFDIDGLTPSECPNTGTPVPGGLEFEDALYLVEQVVESGKRIIGFDLCEVAPAHPDPATWETDPNANVGMRALYRLALYALKSQEVSGRV